jgi:hypothetical protein
VSTGGLASTLDQFTTTTNDRAHYGGEQKEANKTREKKNSVNPKHERDNSKAARMHIEQK